MLYPKKYNRLSKKTNIKATQPIINVSIENFIINPFCIGAGYVKGDTDRPPSLLIFHFDIEDEYLKSAAYFFKTCIKSVFVAFKLPRRFDVLGETHIPEWIGINEIMGFQVLNNKPFLILHALAFRSSLHLKIFQCRHHAFTGRRHFNRYHDLTRVSKLFELLKIFTTAELHLRRREADRITRLRGQRCRHQYGTAINFGAVDFAFELFGTEKCCRIGYDLFLIKHLIAFLKITISKFNGLFPIRNEPPEIGPINGLFTPYGCHALFFTILNNLKLLF